MLRLSGVPIFLSAVLAILVAACAPTTATPTVAPTQQLAKSTTAAPAPTAATAATPAVTAVARPTTTVIAPTATTARTAAATGTTAAATPTVAASSAVTGGDANAGKQLIVSKGCSACHTVPGVPEAKGTIGPNLGGFAGRPQIAGTLTNTAENRQKWLKNPSAVKSGTMMPSANLSDKEISDLSAFLNTLK